MEQKYNDARNEGNLKNFSSGGKKLILVRLLSTLCLDFDLLSTLCPNFGWRWQLFCIWLRLWTSETLSASEPKSDAALTQNLFLGSPHSSHLIYPPPAPAPVVTLGLIAPVRCLKALGRCFLSASFKDPSHPRQCSHAHILARSYHEAADMRSWGHGAWRHESLGRGLHY